MASSVSNFECFVTVGDTKHTICLKKDLNAVVFSDVYNRLKQLSDGSDLSFDSNVFEVFDFEDNAYRRLTRADTPVKYLSRIRVLPKNSSFVANNKRANKRRDRNRRTDYEAMFNPDMFNPGHSRVDRFNQDFYSEDFFSDDLDSSPMTTFVTKRPYRADQVNGAVRKSQLNDQSYAEDMLCNNGNRYGIADYEYQYSEPSMDRPYTRRPAMPSFDSELSFADQYMSPLPPYYRRRTELNYMSPPKQSYPNYNQFNHPNRQPLQGPRNEGPVRPIRSGLRFESPIRPHTQNNAGFWPSFGQRMNSNNSFNYGRSGGEEGQKSQVSPKAVNKSFEESKSHLIANGFTVSSKGQTNIFFCEFCEVTITDSLVMATNHINSHEHKNNSNSERHLDPLDKQILIKPTLKTIEVNRARRQQLRQISVTDKQRFHRHGIRLKDGSGAQAYVCTKCSSSMTSLVSCHKHLDKFFELNECLNYPEDWHTYDEENKSQKPSLRLTRIYNILELKVDDKRSPEDEESLVSLRNEGIVQKEEVDTKVKYFWCLMCDKRLDSSDDSMTHIIGVEHPKNRSINRWKGLERALIVDSERSGQIEVDLARIQEMTKLKIHMKEKYLDHGIRLKDGIEPEAYVCVTCNKKFGSSEEVTTHLNESSRVEEAKKISECNDESLIDSAKTQLELLSPKTDSVSETDQTKTTTEDFTADVDDCVLGSDFEDNFGKECIKEVVIDGITKYHDFLCDQYFTSKGSVVQHLNRSVHNRMKSGDFLSDVDKGFCCSTYRMDEEVVSARVQVRLRLTDEAKAKFTEEGIRLKDGVGREAFWCTLCNEPILSANVESSTMAFINHINYYPKHVELLIAQNK